MSVAEMDDDGVLIVVPSFFVHVAFPFLLKAHEPYSIIELKSNEEP